MPQIGGRKDGNVDVRGTWRAMGWFFGQREG